MNDRIVVTTLEGLKDISENSVYPPVAMRGSSIEFCGRDNVLFCEDGVRLMDTRIVFHGDGALVYLSRSEHPLKCTIHIWGESTFYIGPNSYINRTTPLSVFAGERRSVFIGADVLLSHGVEIRTSDPHLVYSCETHERLNPSKDVFIGDHVWIGERATILKGTTIGSGSIIGCCSVCSSKTIGSNESWAGSPARRVATGVFFTKQSAHPYDKEASAKSQTCRHDRYVYSPRENNELFPGSIRRSLDECETAMGAVEYLQGLAATTAKDKNRFALPSEPDPSSKGVGKSKAPGGTSGGLLARLRGRS